jgi:hypothetical protein
MSNSLRRLKRNQDKDSNELPPEQQKLPAGRVVGDPLRGSFLSLPILGWIALRERERTPLVMLHLALVGEQDFVLHGTLEVELPLYIDTEAATLAALDRYGWAGTTWSLGEPAPFGNEVQRQQLDGLIRAAPHALRATLLFTSDPGGSNLAQNVEVMRAQGRFLMPPLEQPVDPPDAGRLRAFRAIVRDYPRFFGEAVSGEGAADAGNR